MKSRSLLAIALLTLAVGSNAAITLTHNGATLNIDETTGTINDWIVGGTDHVFEHTYFWRSGSTGTAELLSTIGTPTVSLFGSRGAEVVYANSDVRVTVNYFMTASTNGSAADLAESVMVENLGGAMQFTLFQYNDFDLNGSSGNDQALRENSSTISISDVDSEVHEAVEGGTPIPTFSEINNAYPELFDNITGTTGYNLNTAAESGLGESLSGDIAYAFQWDRDMAAGGAWLVSTDKVMAVPEPGSMIALGAGIAALLARRRRSKK